MTFAVTDDRLWTAKELATFLCYSESTVTRMVSQEPEKLPPRVGALGRPRWLPSAALQWVKDNTGKIRADGKRATGRPRRAD